MGGLMRIGRPRQAERFMADMSDQLVHRLKDRRRGAEAAVHRQIEEIALDRLRLAREPGAGDLEGGRIGALEAEDRLLVVTDGEDRAVAAVGALTREIFEAQSADDVPLGLV